MSTIFPREEKAEQIFDEILKNPRACERLKDTFFAAIPSAEESEGAGTDIPGTVFAAALFNAYENKDLSAFMMAVCNNSVFDLLRNSFLIPIRFNDKGVENPIFLTDENGNLLDKNNKNSYLISYATIYYANSSILLLQYFIRCRGSYWWCRNKNYRDIIRLFKAFSRWGPV